MRIFWLIVAGLVGGLVGGMGMGGGTLLIPILTIFLKVEQHMAQAINLISFIPMAVVCLIIHAKNKLFDIKKSWWVALIATLGALGGAFLGINLNGKILSKCLGGFLVLLAVFEFVLFFIKLKKKE